MTDPGGSIAASATPSGAGGPSIAPISWKRPVDVLGGEASHFTPWLASNLDMLGSALDIEGLELVSTEVDVAGKRLDVLAAVGVEADGETVGVAIENQYGTSEHGHLGQLVTYVAGAAATYDRVLGVWLVDHVHAAHEAAIELLNRETTERLGFVLARPRFVDLGDGRFGVDFDVVVRPNEFIRSERRRTASAISVEGHNFLEAVMQLAGDRLKQLGYRTISPVRSGYSVNISWGSSKWRLNVRAGDVHDNFRAYIYVNGSADVSDNEELLEEFLAHEGLIREALHSDHDFVPRAHLTNPLAKRAALATCSWPGVGHGSDPAVAAELLLEFAAGVAAAVRAAGY